MWPLLSLSAFVHAAAVAGGLLVYVMATRIGRQRRHPSVAIAWVLTIAALPYLGVPLFLVFGTRKFARPVRPLHAPHAAHAGAPAAGGAAAAAPRWSLELLRAMDVDAPGVNRVVALHDDGEAALQALLELCRSARSSLALQTFVLREDTVGGAVMQALATAAGRGVQVRLLVDAVGSLWLPRRTEAALAASGVSLCRFMPLVHNPMRGRTNLRNHRKLAVADGRRLWSGGRNLADEYFVDRGAEPAWLDLSFRVDGPLAASALVQFDHDWRLAGGHGAPLAQRPMPSLAPAAAGDAAHAPVPTATHAPVPTATHAPEPTARHAPEPTATHAPAGALVQWLSSGPDRADDTVHALLLSAAWHAQQRLLAVTPYFVPDDALLDAWLSACRRGVRTTLVVPRRSNHRLADVARERSLRELVAAGAEVRLAPRMVHAKAVVVDEAFALCGSVNLDGRSLFLNYEATAVFYAHEQIDWLARWVASLAASGARHHGRRVGMARETLEGLVRAVGFQL